MTVQRISRIVAASDFSGAANAAVKRAARLARELEAELHLFTVVEETALAALRNLLGPKGDAGESSGAATARARLARLARLLHEHYSIRAEAHVSTGVAHAEIAAKAMELAAGLLVVGAHGVRSYRELFLGTTASKVMRWSAAPVLAVRNREIDEYAHALVAVDFSDRSPAMVQLALAIAPRAYVEIVHVVDIPAGDLTEAQDRMTALLARFSRPEARLLPVLLHGRSVHALDERIARLPRRAVVVVGRTRRPAGRPATLGAAAAHVAQEATHDVLIAG